MTKVIDLRALADEDPSAQLAVAVGDEFRFRDISQRFALPFFAPLELNWGHEVYTDLVERLGDLGLHVEQRGLYDVIRDEVGLGVTYRMQLVVLRVVGFEDELLDVAQIPGAEPQIVEASAVRTIALGVVGLLAVLGLGSYFVARVEGAFGRATDLVEATGGKAVGRTAQLVGVAIAIAAGAWLIREVRR